MSRPKPKSGRRRHPTARGLIALLICALSGTRFTFGQAPEKPEPAPPPVAAPPGDVAAPPDPNTAPPAPIPPVADPNAPVVDPNAPAPDPNAPAPAPTPAPIPPVADPNAPAPAPPVATPPADPVKPTVELEPGTDPQTGVRGRVVDRRTGQPLAVAPVLVRGGDGKTRSTLTDDGGGFKVLVPPGTYVVRSYFDLYHGARFDRVRVTRGAFAGINLVLDPVNLDDEVVVQEIEIPYRADTTTAAAQDQLRKESRGIGEGMGSQQMSQQGASDAASAAKRVVGVTIDDNQLVVRGLGGRYVKVLLNGLPVPNTDPDFPSVDLDLFPTNVIDSLNVQKVFLPDIPADFAGGTLDINTVNFPRQFLFEASISTGFNSQTTFRKRLTYNGGALDWLGFDDGTRALPGVLDGKKLVVSRNGGPFPTRMDVETAGKQFENIWQYRRTTGLPKLGLDLTLGDSIKFGNRRRFGYLASVVYDYTVERQVGVTRPKPGSSPTGDAVEASRYDVESASENVQLAAIGTASLDWGIDHSFTALTMFNRSLEDQTRYRIGTNAEVSNNSPYEKWQLKFLARTMFLNQILGDHRNLGGTRARLRWSGFYALGTRDEPDQRTVAYSEYSGSLHRWKPTADRLWSLLNQTDVGGTTSLRFPLWAEGSGSVGGRVGFSHRDFSNRRFQMQEGAAPTAPDAYDVGPEQLFSPEGIGPLTTVTEFTRAYDSYTAKQSSYSGFALLETPVVGALSLAGGARVEAFSQEVASKSPFAEENTPELLAKYRSDRSDVDVLPGAALKYGITESMLVRAAYGMTLSRPQIREVAPYDYYDFLRDRIIIGNQDLKTAHIHNADLRWEWFFGEGQIASVSGFYKKFLDPIELQIVAPNTQDSKYQNSKGATSLGAELELRSDLAFVAKSLKRFSVGGNLSLIDSKIELADSGAVRSSRPLAGQAPYVINLSLRFSDPDTRLSAGLVYNVVGPRITDVGIRVTDFILPDVKEQAFHSVDFVGGWGISKHLKLKLKARNLLLQKKVLKQGSLVAQELAPGFTVSMGLSYEH